MADMANEAVARDACKRLPGRLLRGRWGSIDAIEQILLNASQWLGNVFACLFLKEEKPTAIKRCTPRRPDLGADEEAQFREDQKNYRRNATTLLNEPTFLAAMCISKTAKPPLMHFMRWAMKAVGAQNKEIEKAKTEYTFYLGPTPMSILVIGKAQQFEWSMLDLLGRCEGPDSFAGFACRGGVGFPHQ